jgi:hypothetical protein
MKSWATGLKTRFRNVNTATGWCQLGSSTGSALSERRSALYRRTEPGTIVRKRPQAPRIAVTAQLHMHMLLAAGGRLLTVVLAVMLQVAARHLVDQAWANRTARQSQACCNYHIKNRALSPVAQLFIEHVRSFAKAMARS